MDGIFDGRVYFRFLAALAAADGRVDDSEVAKFRELLTIAQSDPGIAEALLLEAEREHASPLWFMEGQEIDSELAQLCLRDGLVMTCVDGLYSASERRLIVQFAALTDSAHILASLPEAEMAEKLVAPLLPAEPEAGFADQLSKANGLFTDSLEGADGSFYFRLMAAVAAADGEIHPDEVSRFGELIRLSGGDPRLASHLAREAMMRAREPLWFIRSSGPIPHDFARVCLRDAAFVAMSDGHVAAVESELLVEAARLLGVDDFQVPDSDLQPVSSGWREEQERAADRLKIDKALAAAGGATVLAGGGYIVMTGMGAKLAASIAAAAGAGAASVVAPALLLVGAGVSGIVLQIASALGRRR